MADEELDTTAPPWLRLVAAFLAMEPPDSLISLARDCGGGSITDGVQSFIWEHCIRKAEGKCHAPYVKNLLKKLIVEIESIGGEVLDELYEQYAHYMTSLKENDTTKGSAKSLKWVSFLFPDGCPEATVCPKSRKLVIPLQCSLNMLEGDTGCSLWPSSLFLSEFILSCPKMFSSKSCFEVGSGVGLVGICLAHVKASKASFPPSLLSLSPPKLSVLVILTDGDLSSLANLKLNLELNHLGTRSAFSERTIKDPHLVQCMHLPWESAVESELQDIMPDIVLGADVIYNPLCLPHLIRVLSLLLNREKTYPHEQNGGCQRSQLHGEVHGGDDKQLNGCEGKARLATTPNPTYSPHVSKGVPVAYIASVIRNIETFGYFLNLAEQANLKVTDITENVKRFDLLPYMQSYHLSDVRLVSISYTVQ
ncbi:hypothetical protein RJ639_035611 [Escallonia herrerae]|uniref:FAM86 N-terminal domain-containing protein n=1 Tax=Escallonia herrerae TaxID=1293975 RepID=A0AA89B802_9ASTE|nr:hypothetical protein RJ639_035611 [Escallonia herrerae]